MKPTNNIMNFSHLSVGIETNWICCQWINLYSMLVRIGRNFKAMFEKIKIRVKDKLRRNLKEHRNQLIKKFN